MIDIAEIRLTLRKLLLLLHLGRLRNLVLRNGVHHGVCLWYRLLKVLSLRQRVTLTHILQWSRLITGPFFKDGVRDR